MDNRLSSPWGQQFQVEQYPVPARTAPEAALHSIGQVSAFNHCVSRLPLTWFPPQTVAARHSPPRHHVVPPIRGRSPIPSRMLSAVLGDLQPVVAKSNRLEAHTVWANLAAPIANQRGDQIAMRAMSPHKPRHASALEQAKAEVHELVERACKPPAGVTSSSDAVEALRLQIEGLQQEVREGASGHQARISTSPKVTCRRPHSMMPTR